MPKKRVREYAVNLLMRMLKTYSPTGREAPLSQLLKNELQHQGFNAYIDEVGNAIGEHGSGELTVLLCGHMDTVPGRLPIKIQDGIIYGRGAVDAKAPLAALIVAASLLKNRAPFRLIVAGVIEEEGESLGIKHLIDRNVTADYTIFGEPSGVGNINIAYKGSLHLKLKIRTQPGHSSAPWLHHNAVEDAFAIYQQIKEMTLEYKNEKSWFYSLTSSLTQIKGGSEFSTIPSRCTMHINMRIPPSISLSIVITEVKHIIQKYETEGRVTVNLEVIDSCPSYEADKNSLLVRSIAYGIRQVTKNQAVLVRRTGSGDMNLFGSARKTPIITYGPGDSHLDHTSNEQISIKDYIDSIQILYTGLMKLPEMHDRMRARKTS
ncbi:MAG: M20/M25/M40 family metallo-hydrolase [Candidatus Bathyarchaeota archaeon]|nr:MAG: M20/M25/M40 family metallo-hydrolase [Candidatus Bathyarchaeota archaeon]